MFKDFFNYRLKSIPASLIMPGDFIHQLYDRRKVYDLEKQRGFVEDTANVPHWKSVDLRIRNRKGLLRIRTKTMALITRRGGELLCMIPSARIIAICLRPKIFEERGTWPYAPAQSGVLLRGSASYRL